ncbi:hypothetical protein [Egibacter rhizosphaerae]|uniref:hypothetical protein n=1 Tax=Egibacter rhizosphaerae TaxID=1670831 RepID=UPI0013F15C0B|nr:hypothetical protein [Egibacter rhizosphaerae]
MATRTEKDAKLFQKQQRERSTSLSRWSPRARRLWAVVFAVLGVAALLSGLL